MYTFLSEDEDRKNSEYVFWTIFVTIALTLILTIILRIMIYNENLKEENPKWDKKFFLKMLISIIYAIFLLLLIYNFFSALPLVISSLLSFIFPMLYIFAHSSLRREMIFKLKVLKPQLLCRPSNSIRNIV